MDMNTITLLKELTEVAGLSGFESDIADHAVSMLKDFCENVNVTKSRSVVADVNTWDSNKRTLMIEAHLDRIGLMVSEICENGFVRVKALGGVDERILPGSECFILGRKTVYGVIGAVPPHLLKKDEKKAVKMSDIVVDTGLGDECQSVVSVGDPILLKSDFCTLADEKASSAAIDNRAGMTAVMLMLERLRGRELPVNLKIVFASGEELGLLGARTLPMENCPDLAVVVDVTHGQTRDCKAEGTFVLGAGVEICRGPNLHYDAANKIIEIAKDKNIPFEIEVASGNTGTNAWVLQTLEKGIACALLSIPVRYMHTTVETVDIRDIESTAQLLAEVVLNGGGLLA